MGPEGPSRPSTDERRANAINKNSRFAEGSMNDRISSAPPPAFLGPDQLASFERQFYTEPEPEPKRESRSSSSKRRERPYSASAQLQAYPYSSFQEPQDGEQGQRPSLQSKRSTGFLGRVRDVLGFGRATRNQTTSKVQLELEKRQSLQQPFVSRPPPRGGAKSQSQTNIPQMPTAVQNGTADRPSRDEILQSYNQLMATGFFQAHAIQSTRQPLPGAGHVRQSNPLPSIPSPGRVVMGPPTRAPPALPVPIPQSQSRSSLAQPSRAPPPPPRQPSTVMAVPNSPERMDAVSPATSAFASPASAHSTFIAPPRFSGESSRYPLRGRKRARAESDDHSLDIASPSSQHSVGVGKRVSKKLRKMPSGTSSSLTADGFLRATSGSSRGSSASRRAERAVRMRSPSPATPRAGSRGRGSRPSSSGSGGTNRLRKRGKSPARSYPPVTLDKYQFPQGFEHRDSMDIDQNTESFDRDMAMQEAKPAAEPLSVVPNANRGIPSVPRIPAHWKRAGGVWDENSGVLMDIDPDLRFGELLPGLH